MSADNRENAPLPDGQAGRKHRDIDEVDNGSMVQDEQDMKRLGKDMERMRTNAELEEDGLVPDPAQD